MIVTKKVVSQFKKRYRGVMRVLRFEWPGMENEYDESGYNQLLNVGTQEMMDIVESDLLENMVGTAIPERDGFVMLEVRCYGKRDEYEMGSRSALLNSDGDLVWWSHAKKNDKVGEVVARHFGVE